MKKAIFKCALFCGVIAGMSGLVSAQPFPLATFTDIGSAPPAIGAHDLYCTNTAGNRTWAHGTGGLNYYTDQNTPGQVFGMTNPLVVNSVAIRTGGLETGSYPGGSTPFGLGPEVWYLRLYTVSGGTATLVAAFQSDVTATISADGDWIQWTGLNVQLPAGTNAYSFQRSAAPNSNWDALAVCSNSPAFFTGGQIAMLPAIATGSGGVTLNAFSSLYNANFVLSMSVPVCPIASTPQLTGTNIVFSGSPVTLTENGSGVPPLYYQWQTDGGQPTIFTNIVGATSSTLTAVPPLTGSPIGYRCIVSNSTCVFSPAISAATNIGVVAASLPFNLTDPPTPATAHFYSGQGVSFTGLFDGTQPISYQWQTDTGNGGVYTNVPGATNAQIFTGPLTLGGNYKLTASNSVGGPVIGLNPATAVLDANFGTRSAAYPVAVMALGPIAYWGLNESTLPSTSLSVPAFDYSGNGLHGTWGSGAADGVGAGLSSISGFPGFEAGNTGGQFVNGGTPANSNVGVPGLGVTVTNFTAIAWLNPQASVPASCGIYNYRNGSDAAGFNFGTTVSPSTSIAELGYTWNTNAASTYNFHSALYPPSNVWSFAALTITPSNASIYLMFRTNGQSFIYKNVNNIPHIPEALTNGTSWLASDNFSDGRDFPGAFDEVSLFTQTLSDAQLQNLFFTAVGNFTPPPPTFGGATNANKVIFPFPGQLVQWSLPASGALPLTYHWQSAATPAGPFSNLSDGGVNEVSGSGTSLLTVSNAIAAAYRLVVNGPSSSITSSVATVTVVAVPNGNWVANYAVTNNIGDYGLYKGHGVLGIGTNWNVIPAISGLFIAATNTSVTNFRDDGTTPTGMSVTVASAGGAYSAPVDGILLLSQWLGGANVITVTNVPNGLYNLAVYCINGSFENATGTVDVNGVTNNVVNIQDLTFALNDNVTIFQFVSVTNNFIQINDSTSVNGLQIQSALMPSLGVQKSGANVILTWPLGGGSLPASTLQTSSNVKGPWVPLTGATSPFTTNILGNNNFYRISIP